MPESPSDVPPQPPPAHPHSKVLVQVSPWRDPTHGVLLTFFAEGSDRACIRVLATSQNTLLERSRYTLGTEYWYAVGALPENTPLYMKYEHGPWTADEIDSLVADLPLAFSAPQEAQGLWRSTPQAAPEGTFTRRFTAPDPENPAEQQIGLALSFNERTGLVSSTWYRVNEPRTGYVWHNLVAPRDGLVWTPARSLERLTWNFAQGYRPR